MRKEILFAIVAGGVLGLVIAFGIWRANSILSPQRQEPEKVQEEAEKESSGLTIAKPEQNEVVTETPVILTGIARPNSWITISGESDDYVLQAESSGSFQQEVELTAGVNEIVVTSFDESANSSETRLTVVFSTEFAESEASANE